MSIMSTPSRQQMYKELCSLRTRFQNMEDNFDNLVIMAAEKQTIMIRGKFDMLMHALECSLAENKELKDKLAKYENKEE